MTEPIGQECEIVSMADIEPADRSDQHAAPAAEQGQRQSQSPPPDDEARKQREADRKQEQRRQRARPFVRAGMVIVLIALIAGGVYYYLSTKNIETTDDAYTDGRAITISPRVSGQVVSLDVNDNQFVRKGDPLIHIDPRQYEAAVEQAQGQLAAAQGQLNAAGRGFEVAKVNFPARLQQARAQLADAQANLFKAQTDYKRQQSLSRGATSGQQVDYATAALHSAQAQVESAEAAVTEATPVQPNVAQSGAQVKQLEGTLMQADANLKTAQLNLEWCILRAPQDGWITRRNVETGNYVTPGQQVFSIVSPEVWVTANFKENQLARMRAGEHVTITVDAYPSLKLSGHIDSVQLGSGSKFTAFPPENATGNFVKIVQRVPVKIDIDSGLDPNLPLPLGISVSPTVDLPDTK
jgi:membrane fusion protein (multidrug efflux system)